MCVVAVLDQATKLQARRDDSLMLTNQISLTLQLLRHTISIHSQSLSILQQNPLLASANNYNIPNPTDPTAADSPAPSAITMSRERPLSGGCSCGRNRYVIRIPQDATERPQVFFDNSHAQRTHHFLLPFITNADKNPLQADPRQPRSPHGSVSPSPGTNLQLLLFSTTKHNLRSVEHILHPKSRAASATFAGSAGRPCHIGLNRHLLKQTIFLSL